MRKRNATDFDDDLADRRDSTPSGAFPPPDPSERGRLAEEPTDIPPRGWKDILLRTKAETKQDRVNLVSAGVAFYALLAAVPALVAVVSIYGLVANPSTIDRQMNSWLGTAPREVRELLRTQLQSITENARTQAGIGVVVGIVLALWSASSGMGHLVDAINLAYDEDDDRGFIRSKGLALLFTLGAVVFVLFAIGMITILPSVLADAGVGSIGRLVVSIARWVLLLFGMMAALAVLYRYAPDRDDARWRWITPGAVVATVLWIIASALFAFYTANFAKYNQTYGSLGVVVVVMLWLFITAMCVLIGAELNCEAERQTMRDSTRGPERPMGEREATAADTLGPTSDEIRGRDEREHARSGG
jgi:membrane protein